METLIAVVVGYVLDLLIGDPRWMPHPVVTMGRAISWLEPRLRARHPDSPAGARRAGVELVLLVAGEFSLAMALVLALAGLVSPWLRLAVSAWVCYQLMATCELWRQSMAVRRRLVSGDLPGARKAVSMIVGRDTEALDEAGVTRATVETVAENASDGVVAPLVFMLVAGPVGGILYKAVNTMDSMVGYKNEHYLDFGRAAARLDDVLNWFPSRLCALAMVVCSPVVGLSASGAWRIWRRDRRRHSSPNSAQTESAMAGALGVRLAGDASYFGKLVNKPTIGDPGRPVEPDDIARANRLMVAASVLVLLVGSGIRWGVVAWLG